MSEDTQTKNASVYFLLFAGLLSIVLILSKELHRRPKLNSVFSEAALTLLFGMVVGFLVENFIVEYEAANDDDELTVADSLVSFQQGVFFMALLPPILFNSGYQLRRELFYRHIKPIALFACLGTSISAITTALGLYGIKNAGLMGGFDPSLLELLTFGALIAATDTVSTLAILQAKQVDPHIFYLVFGESALNDAVALVLFKTLSNYLVRDVANTVGSMAKLTGMLLFDFAVEAICSPILGIVSSFAAAIIFKLVDMREQSMLELSLYILLMYIPFIAAENMLLSGIVTIFFSGMSARRYIEPNLSDETRHNANVIFQLAAYLAEVCIFLELGLSVFGFTGNMNWRFTGWAFLASLIGRAVSIYPISFLYNWSLGEIALPEADNYSASITKGGHMHIRSEIEEPSSSMPPPPEYPVPEGMSMPSTTPDAATAAGLGWMGPDQPMMDGVACATPPTLDILSERVTPHKRRDKVISTNMMHILWFSGLRGAVAYACAREFPDVFGHDEEIIAATIVIVLGTVIVMGGATEPLLQYLNIRMNVDEDTYMKNWHAQRRLEGRFHQFEREYIYRTVVRQDSNVYDNAYPGENPDLPSRSYSDIDLIPKRSTSTRNTGLQLNPLERSYSGHSGDYAYGRNPPNTRPFADPKQESLL